MRWSEDAIYGTGSAQLLLISCFPSFRAQAQHTVHRGSSEPALNKHRSENEVLCPGKVLM